MIDPVGTAGPERVIRGGGWFGQARLVRAACRLASHPGNRVESLGFRLAAGGAESHPAGDEARDAPRKAGLLDQDDVGILMDALREQRAGDALLRRFGVGWAERLTLDQHGLCAEVAGFRLRWIPAGEFLMGAPEDEEEREGNEPQHPVRISRGFWLGETPVTQAQWLDVMGANPSHFRNGEDWPSRPVEQVSWDDCQGFLERLPDGLTWRLPTEAEWEYACRAGTTEARYGQLEDVAWFGVDSTMLVATKAPNPWGLYDMLGNVWEWCADHTEDWSAPPAGFAP